MSSHDLTRNRYLPVTRDSESLRIAGAGPTGQRPGAGHCRAYAAPASLARFPALATSDTGRATQDRGQGRHGPGAAYSESESAGAFKCRNSLFTGKLYVYWSLRRPAPGPPTAGVRAVTVAGGLGTLMIMICHP